ncbi:uncharacterized protein LOC126782575 [Argentina anserina]|uniref:uncharacterized protein LOC126782575 n=1 Tax=Argentina anserina TaxID=57926 RepID=UPI0021767E8B|nr:uncharacterized protein LOC126782575 [Potentilla anserina]
MYELLIPVVIAEAVVASLMLLKIGPLRELVLKILDQLKVGSGPVTLIGIAGTMGVILLSRFISIIKMQNKGEKLGTMSPMDQVLYRTHILEASLMSFAVFLGFIIDRTHDYLTKLDGLTSTEEEVERLQKEKAQLTEKEEKSSKEIKQLQDIVATLSENLKKLKLECVEKDKAVETAESHVTSLQKQAADLLLEYDHLLEDNQKLQAQFAGHKR